MLVFLVALVARVLVAVFLTEHFSGSLVLDDSTYSQMAATKAAEQTRSWDAYTRFLYDATATFMIPLTAVYEVFGPVKLAGQIFVATIGAGVAAATTRLGLEAMPAPWAVAGGIIVGLLPSEILWSSLLLKDAMVWLVVAVIAVIVAIAGRSSGLRLAAAGVLIGLCLFLLSRLRIHTHVVAAIALIPAAFFGSRAQRGVRVAGAALLSIGVPWLIGVGPMGIDFALHPGSLEARRLANAANAQSAIVAAEPEPAATQNNAGSLSDLELEVLALQLGSSRDQIAQMPPSQLAEAAQEAATGAKKPARSASELGLSAEDARAIALGAAKKLEEVAASRPPPPPGDASDELEASIEHLPRGISVMLFEPYPWQSGSSTGFLLARLETILWYPVLLLAALGLFRVRDHLRVVAFPLLFGGGMMFVYALAEGNVGTAYRHRGEFVWAVALLAAMGLLRIYQKRGNGGDDHSAGLEGV